MSLHPHRQVERPIAFDLPDDAPVDVWATSATHIGASIDDVVINRVHHRVRLDLHLRDGKWQRGAKDDWQAIYHGIMISRCEPRKGTLDTSTSGSARLKALAVFEPWLVKYAESSEGRELLIEAERARIAWELQKVRTRRAELDAEAEDLRKRELYLTTAGRS